MAVWQRRGMLASALFPFSLLFAGLVAVRRAFYRFGLIASERLPVSVVVVGNITVGGSGKTPVVINLAQALRARGKRPGIISRGYRGAAVAQCVTAESDPAQVGDEPLLLARRAACPVFVGRDRVVAAKALLAQHPDVDVIISDDGLQHYRLARDCEIAVFDRRGVMNGLPLPAGPLREPTSRLASVDALVLNGIAVSPTPTFGHPVFLMDLLAARFYRLDDPAIQCTAADFSGKALHAVAGIGDPSRFFEQLAALGLTSNNHAFDDHHAYRADELDFTGDALLTTEKDAVKLARLSLSLPVWVLPVTAEVKPDLAAFVAIVLEKIDGRTPA